MILQSILLFHFITVLIIPYPTVESYVDMFHTCVDRFGSNGTGCSLSLNCCSTVSELVLDLRSHCDHPDISQPQHIVINIKSDLTLNGTVNFGVICNKSIKIKGGKNIINCSNEIRQIRKNEGQGFCFIAVQNVSIVDLTFLGCGSLQSSTSRNVSNYNSDSTYLFPTTLYFLNCTNITLLNITVSHSAGTGVALFDTVGNVTIVNCLFKDNKVRERLPLVYPGGGGLYIEFTKCTPGYLGNCQNDSFTSAKVAYYVISHCYFENNNASLLNVTRASYVKTSSSFQGMGKGGGIALYINGHSANHSIFISNCILINNSAVFGGGLFVQFRDNPVNTSLVIKATNFTNNSCYIYGGGGISLGFVISNNSSNSVANNTINLIDCVFERNSAKGNGGGLSIFSTKGKSARFSATNIINITNCHWSNNSAFVASAIDIAPEVYSRLGTGLLPKVIIDNCTFQYNHITDIVQPFSPHFNAKINGLTTVFISGFQVNFTRNICFQYNNGTGIYLTSASIVFKERSNIHFEGNIGKYGGAITVTSFSVLYIENQCSLWFVNNTSLTKGGAILMVYTETQHEADFSHSCFMQRLTHEFQSDNSGIEFHFKGNIARSDVGNVLFATTLLPCMNRGNSTIFDGLLNTDKFEPLDIASPVVKFSINRIDSLDHIIPGSEVTLDISTLDELNQPQKDVVYEAFMISAEPSNSIAIDPAYSQVSKNTVKFLGTSGSIGRAQFETERASLTIEITLSECPPGFLNKGNSCKCSESESKYEGISSCEGNMYRSLLVRGFWIGWCKNHTICTGRCPHGYCFYNGSTSERIELPSSMTNLDSFLCGKYRTGVLCNKCTNGSSVHYHSHSYQCYPNSLCSYGILFYLSSEIVPLTIVFLLVMIFNVSLTSGAVNGFVLFAQVADSIDISAQGSIEFPKITEYLSFPYRLIYRLFNFDFFSLEPISFCFWESATTLDILAVKFVTIAYALFLVLFTVLILNSWKCKMLCAWFRPRTLRAALTHGLTTLLVICISQCARISTSILAATRLAYPDQNEVVVLYNGGLHPFHKGHLQYAIPALFFLIFLVVVPTMWLLLYPLLFMMLAKCHLSESSLSQILTKLFPIELLDSFQSCFKDNCRHFAGLYFLYRLAPLTAAVNSHVSFYTLTSVEFLFMFALHSAFQPYKCTAHNRIDSFIFTNLLLVNILTAYNYNMISSEDHFPKIIKFTVIHIQLVLMYLPLVYISIFCMIKILKKLKQHCSGYVKINNNFEHSSSLPQLRDVTESNYN